MEDKVFTLDIKATDSLDSIISKINADSGCQYFL